MLEVTRVCSGEVVFIVVAGQVQPGAVQVFRGRLAALVPTGARRVVIDASQLEYIFSEGLDVLVELAVRLKDAGGQLRIVHVPAWLRRLLAQMRLDQVMVVEGRA